MILCVRSAVTPIGESGKCAYLIHLRDGKEQLADYLKTEGVSEGYYVVFSSKHTAADTLYFDETINGKRIYTYIILTNFERPSRRRPRKTARKE